MDVFDRPLFQNRAARDRLKDMGNVQGFQVGGPVIPGTFSGGVMADPSGAITRQFQRRMSPAGISSIPFSFSATPDDLERAKRSLDLAERQAAFYEQAFAEDPTGDNLAEYQKANETVKSLRNNMGNLQSQVLPEVTEPERGVLAVEGPEAMMMQMSPEQLDIFNNLDRAAEKPAPELPVMQTGPSPMEADARARAPRAPAAAETAAAMPTGRSTMEADARDRGPLLSDPAAVAAGLNAEDPAVREKTIADFMKEYTDAAPKYEGMDKGLLLAQIGFAIAAGESPNAMQNIANGLLAGSDAMLKDKAAKDEFDRQVKLAAMQYGFGEMARDRELERSVTNYIAARDIVYRGRKFPKGMAVPVLNSDIINNRLPEGLLDTAFADTLATKEAAVLDSLQKQYEQNIIDDTELRANSDAYSALVDEAARLQRGDDYFRTGLMILGREGEATGGPGTLKKFVYQMASAAGIDPKDLDSYISDPAELEKVLTRGANAAFRNYLGDEAGNSISNMDVTRNVRSIVSGVTAEGSFEALFKNEDAVIRDIQDALAENEGQRARNLGQMAAIERRLAGRYTKAGSLANPQPALDVLAPLRESAGIVSTQNPSPGDIVVDENGVWTLYIPEN